MLINNKKTKIVATLGPSSDSKETMLEMIKSGVNVFRINYSHASFEEAKGRVDRIREINEEYGFNVAVLSDLQGPKLRVGVIKEGTVVKPGDIVTMTNTPCEGDATRAYMTYENFAKDVKAGERILLDDGKLVFEVAETNNVDEVKCKVIQGGPFRSKKGVNLPNTNISLPALTTKDKEDVKTALAVGTDWFALSFVRNAKDIQDLREEIKKYTDDFYPIISKIEKPEAVEDMDEIMLATDAIMVARGDLGIEIPAEQVPLVQKELVNKARKHCRPVIIATQMMESMMESMNPSRSDVNDVANSVLDGADAVMLSGETAMGDYPIDVIQQMTRIITSVEGRNELLQRNLPEVGDERYVTNTVCYQAVQVSKQLPTTKAIITTSSSGYTALQVASNRPDAHILVFTDDEKVLRRMNLVWGVRAFHYDDFAATESTVNNTNKLAEEKGYVAAGEHVVNLISMPVREKGKVNTMRISKI